MNENTSREPAAGMEQRVAELERRLAERAAQAEATDQELEAFAYSVSHDLRAPLRAIDGFSRILSEDYGERLDDEGRRLLKAVRDNAQRMDRLIDDILQYSRAGRAEMSVAEIDMEKLAQEVAQELAPGTRAIVDIGPLPRVRGDRALLRQAVLNLLSNALKFSRTRPDAFVTVSGFVDGGEASYIVRDNGIGFDPQYAGRLFGVFQRLHGAAESEGNGIGLAIVKRIVGRHGGRVWAEGKTGEGAAFGFTLPHETATQD